MIRLLPVLIAPLLLFSTTIQALASGDVAVVSATNSQNESAGQVAFGGVGLQVVPTATGELVVLNVVADAPAARQGMLPGDLIFRVDDFPLKGSDFGKVISNHLWGPIDSTVRLFFLRPGVQGQKQVEIKRTSIDPRLTVTPAVQGASAGNNAAALGDGGQ